MIGLVLVAGVALAVVQPGDLGGTRTATAPSSSRSTSTTAAIPTTAAPSAATTPTSAARTTATSTPATTALTTGATTPATTTGGGLDRSGAAGAEDALSTTGGTSLLAPALALVAVALVARRRARATT